MFQADLTKKIKIMVCADGFVSILEKPSDRRLRDALPAYSTDTIEEAFEIVGHVTQLSRCAHGGKVGTLLEPKAIDWPYNATTLNIQTFGEECHKAHMNIKL